MQSYPMILDYQTFNLFGKQIFEKAKVSSPFELPSQMQQSACFLYVVEGGFKAFGPTREVPVKKSQSVLVKCGNYIYKTRESLDGTINESIVIHFDLDVLKKIYGSQFLTFIQHQVKKTDERITNMGRSVLIDDYIKNLLFYFNNPTLINDEILILKLKEVILLLLQTEYASTLQEVFSNLLEPATFKFKEVIESHIFNDVSVPNLAVLTNRSLSSFKREFKKVYNESPARYIINRRISAAKEKLEFTSDSISNVAFDCGFKDLSHFSKAFKDRYGVSPTSFRSKVNETR